VGARAQVEGLILKNRPREIPTRPCTGPSQRLELVMNSRGAGVTAAGRERDCDEQDVDERGPKGQMHASTVSLFAPVPCDQTVTISVRVGSTVGKNQPHALGVCPPYLPTMVCVREQRADGASASQPENPESFCADPT
jgi:hypothetical protein